MKVLSENKCRSLQVELTFSDGDSLVTRWKFNAKIDDLDVETEVC